MKKLELKQLEQIEGGSWGKCLGRALVGSIFGFFAGGPAGAGLAGASAFVGCAESL